MKIFFASDHAGFELKNALIGFVKTLGHEAIDCGAERFDEGDDYPDIIPNALKEITQNTEARAIILGGSGQGEAIVANRISGVRAIVYYGGNLDIVTIGRGHNDANALSLGARFVSEDEAREAVQRFLNASFSNEERHTRRINKIDRNG
jgi:ribose 5-phosphate isomerase B